MAVPRKPPTPAVADVEYLALFDRVSELEAEVADLRALKNLSEEDITYIKNARLAADHAGWAWNQIRVYTPWVISITSAIGAGIYWILTHISFKHGGS